MRLLHEVPSDVVLIILYSLDVRELVMLGLTCKSLYCEIYGNRALWISLVHRLIEKECIDRSTFPLEMMSMEGLKRLASRPLRLYRDLVLKRPVNLTTKSIRVDPGPDFPTRGWEPSSNPHAFLVPGGRWAIGCAWDGTHYRVYCWDLNSANSVIYRNSAADFDHHITPTASLIIDHDNQLVDSIYTVIHEADPQNRRTVVLIGFEIIGFLVMEIVSVTWGFSYSTSPTISRLNYLCIPRERGDQHVRTFMECNMVGVRWDADDWWLIWDWRAHSVVKVDTPNFEVHLRRISSNT
ncbi:uncharacterized protein EI90DRAFT_2410150 [Cantharellus anzutake]|uniref:uncharacterized protein n=1 Tax=Cantharellus anzutake TaxID=1750568 RepID=UPI001904C9D7|nr:uncharacterized protein EI90DRAFT_2410150 [Cantharellus anzutake]KAF8338759.1 hypothetical protein EI90DRAFT_2410150 [Cantharellus anzutake]